MSRRVEEYLKSEAKKANALVFVLIDSEISNMDASIKLARGVEQARRLGHFGGRFVRHGPDGHVPDRPGHQKVG